ncbi:hypothetical protein BCR34DRAFT_464367, partial [Clohesyomyces aquaticus]
TIDYTYEPQNPLDIVISMYKEPTEDVHTLIKTVHSIPTLSTARVHIYLKSTIPTPSTILAQTGADTLTLLPNNGRESETYLNHILTHWDTLAKHTLFIQADVHNPREFYPRIRNYFDPARTGFLSLGFPGQVCELGNCGDRWGWTEGEAFLRRLYTQVYPVLLQPGPQPQNRNQRPKHLLLSYKGQFFVSSSRIRGTPKSVYETLHSVLNDSNSWAHQPEYVQGRPDEMSAPVFGYTMERLWNLVFQCQDMDVAWKCPSLVSGKRIGGGRGDCQCFDD